MKKALLVLLALCVLLSVAACAEPTPIEKCQQKVVSIGEAFLNYEITGTEAREQLQAIVVPETEGNGQTYLKADKGYLAFIIAKQDASYEEIEERVESIRKATYE